MYIGLYMMFLAKSVLAASTGPRDLCAPVRRTGCTPLALGPMPTNIYSLMCMPACLYGL